MTTCAKHFQLPRLCNSGNGVVCNRDGAPLSHCIVEVLEDHVDLCCGEAPRLGYQVPPHSSQALTNTSFSPCSPVGK